MAEAARLHQLHGRYSTTALSERFGSWNKALRKAGLPLNNVTDTPDARLFENLERVWVQLCRQPGRRDMVKPHSEFSEGPYVNRFGSWNKALEAFMDYVNEGEPTNAVPSCRPSRTVRRRRTMRDPDLRLKWRVLQKDAFKCRACGKGWPNVELNIDHVVPWSKGGDTEMENLQTLCSKCNLGKGNLQ
jgi:5-methylcytosine-specific restriction endonuclease McrA